MAETPIASSTTTLKNLSAALTATRLELELEHSAAVRSVRDELAGQIDDYLVPRLSRLHAPLLVVLGGSTGSGKSTITNSLLGRDVSPAGVLRPTTRAPVLVCHPDDAAWFSGGDILPDLPRVTGSTTATSGAVLRMETADSLTPGLALIDAPDIDSVERANRVLATQLLAAADLWLFVTTAVRYADAVPWEFLRRAQSRGTALALVVNRIPPGAATEIGAHLQQMLTEASLGAVPIHTIDQSKLVEGRLPPDAFAPIARSLSLLAADLERRAEVVATTLTGALASIASRTTAVIDAAEEQAVVAASLDSTIDKVYGRAHDDLSADITGGALLRGEVLDRWQELIGTAELMRAVQSRISWIRDRAGWFLTGRTGATAQVEGEITSTLERLLVDYADRAALLVCDNWRNLPGGRQVLGDDRTLERASSQFRSGIGAELRAWQDDILELVRQRGAGKRTVARALALGVNSIGITLMIVLFAQTGGITGGELAIGAGTAGVSQTLLTAVFGEQAVRDLAAEARRLLLDRVGGELAADAQRFRSALRSTVGPGGDTDRLRVALAAFEATR